MNNCKKTVQCAMLKLLCVCNHKKRNAQTRIFIFPGTKPSPPSNTAKKEKRNISGLYHIHDVIPKPKQSK